MEYEPFGTKFECYYFALFYSGAVFYIIEGEQHG